MQIIFGSQWRIKENGDKEHPVVKFFCEFEDSSITELIVASAVDMIEKAKKFNGAPITMHSAVKSKAKVSVSFALMFNSVEDSKKCVRFLFFP